MPDDTTPRFDPRFNPAFQRGFDPVEDGDEFAPAGTATRVATAPSAPLAPASPPAVVPVTASPLDRPAQSASPAPAPVSAPVVTAPSATGPVVETADADAPPSASTRNPYLLALAIIAVLLIGAGAWLFARTGAQFNDPASIRSSGSYMTLEATILAAPLIMTVGVGTAIGVLFLFAVRWRGRR